MNGTWRDARARLSSDQRVVITGLGVVSAIGTGKDAFWAGLLRGQNGVRAMAELAELGLGIDIAGAITDFEPGAFMSEETAVSCGRTSQLAIAAARLALDDARCFAAQERTPMGVFMGTTMGEANVQEAMVAAWHRGAAHIRREDVLQVPDCVVALNVCRALDLKADCMVFPTACAAGNYAIGHAYDLIRDGQVAMALAGGADAFSRIAFMGFGRMLALAPHRCQPFDLNRSGIVVGEGSAIVVMETLSRALARGAPIYAEMLGYGLSCDAHHMTAPHPKGVEAVIANAMRDAQVTPDDIDLFCAHGTGTRLNDQVECQALLSAFGEAARRVPVISIKSMLGHAMGAASALEAVACILAVRDGKIPPTIHFETPDDACPVDCVPNHMRTCPVQVAFNNALAFGGNNAATVFAQCAI